MKITKKYLQRAIKEEVKRALHEQSSRPLKVPGKVWKLHPVLKSALKLVLNNRQAAGLDEFDGTSSVISFLDGDKRSASSLARILVGPYCDSVERCTELFREEGDPLTDGSWLESFALAFGNYKAQMQGGGL